MAGAKTSVVRGGSGVKLVAEAGRLGAKAGVKSGVKTGVKSGAKAGVHCTDWPSELGPKTEGHESTHSVYSFHNSLALFPQILEAPYRS